MAAITTTDIQNYLAANPGMSDATIASLMDQYGVTPAQMAAATGLSTEAVQNRYSPSITTIAPYDRGEGGQTDTQYFINGQAVNPTYTYSSGGAYDADTIATIGGYTGGITHIGDQDYVPHYNASGQLTGYTPYAGGSWLDSGLVEMVKFLGPAILAGAYAGGAFGGTGAGAGAAGAGLEDAALADIAGGMVPEFGTNAAYDAFMTGAMTPEALAAIESQIANSSVAGLTIDEILAQGGALTTPTATPPVVVPNTVTPASTAPTITPAATTPSVLSNPQVLSTLAKTVFPGLLTAGAVKGLTNTQSSGAGAIPTQTVPTNNADYYNAIQNYYNTYLPNNQKDVVTPLQNWYSSKYGA